MPDAKLPSSPKGWLVALASAIVGFLAGFITIAIMARMLA